MRLWLSSLFAVLLILPAGQAVADIVLAARTIRSNTIISAEDVILQKSDATGPASKLSDVVGLESRVVLYKGRPISLSDVGPAAVIQRNQTVRLIYSNGPLVISAAGRSLGRAGVGDMLKVMNLASRNTVFGTVGADGAVFVGNTGSDALN